MDKIKVGITDSTMRNSYSVMLETDDDNINRRELKALITAKTGIPDIDTYTITKIEYVLPPKKEVRRKVTFTDFHLQEPANYKFNSEEANAR